MAWDRIRLDLPGHPFNGKVFRLHAICQSARPGRPPALREDVFRDNISAIWLNVIAGELLTTTYALYVLPKRAASFADCRRALQAYDVIIRGLEREARRPSFGAYMRLRRAQFGRQIVVQHMEQLGRSVKRRGRAT